MSAHRRAETLFFCVLCATGLWGQAGRLLPAPFDDWYSVPYRAVGHYLVGLMPAPLAPAEKLALYQLIEGYALAFALPLVMLRSFRTTPGGAGLRLPVAECTRVTLGGILLTLPVGFFLATSIADPWGTPLEEFLQYLGLLPEHFLIFGVFGALLMPERRLAWPAPASNHSTTALSTIAVTGVIFGLIHVGGPHRYEIATSFPLGLLFAFMTIYSGSVWPAIVAHCTLNLIPLAVLAAVT